MILRPRHLIPFILLMALAWFLYERYIGNRFTPPLMRPAADTKPLTPEQRGRLVFLKYGCSMCHGQNADKGVSNPNSQTRTIPGLLYTKDSYSLNELLVRLRTGAAVHPENPKLPDPPFRMPGWQGQMTDREMSDLCAYLFSLMPKKTKDEW